MNTSTTPDGTASEIAYTTIIEPLKNEKWWGGILNDGHSMPYVNTDKPRNLANDNMGGTTSSFLVSSEGRYVWSDRPFTYESLNGTLTITSPYEHVQPVQAGATLREAYLDACQKHFPFSGTIPAELLFTMPQWNNWIEIAIHGMKQSTVDNYTEELAKSGFPCGVYIMDGGWFSYQGSYEFYTPDFPDPKAMFKKIRDKGWKSMIWTAHFVSPDSREFKKLRHGPGYMIDGLDYLAYVKNQNKHCMPGPKTPGVVWWWSGISSIYDLTYRPAWEFYAKTLQEFADRFGIDGFKFDAGDIGRLVDNVRFHDPAKEACDYAHDYVRIGAEKFPYNEYRSGFNTGGMPVMQRLRDQFHSWEALKNISLDVQAAGLLGSPYIVADMIGGGMASSFRPGGFFSEKIFVRSAALQTFHPMMQFSAAPWRYLSPEGIQACRDFADLHIKYASAILELAHNASKTGEPIVRSMEYQFPHQGFNRAMTQFTLGSDIIVAPVLDENDSVTVELPAGIWIDDQGKSFVGPTSMTLENVPLNRLPFYTKKA